MSSAAARRPCHCRCEPLPWHLMTAMGTPPQQRTSEPPATRPPKPPRRRPASMDPSELGFKPQHPVHWLSPMMLVDTAVQVLLSNMFGEFLDKRELQAHAARRGSPRSGRDRRRHRRVVRLRGGSRRRLQPDVHDRVSAGPGPARGRRRGTLPRGPVPDDGRRRDLPDAVQRLGTTTRPKGPYKAALPSPPPDGPRRTCTRCPATTTGTTG